MFLTGTFARTLDEKLRLPVPKTLRTALGDELERALFVAPGTDGSLAIYPEQAFGRVADKLADHSPTAKQVRDYARLFFARAELVTVDAHGRIRIPTELAKLANLAEEVVLIGVRDHIEVWSKAAWDQYLDDRGQQFDAIAEAALQSE